jgi:predicted small secreted protein
MYFKDRRSEVEKIHQEIFTNSMEHKYYTLGVAQGISFVYNLINTYKDKNLTSEQWLEVINNSASQDDKIGEYFQRIINAEQKDNFLASKFEF